MKKKLLIVLFLLFVFVYVKPVFALDSIDYSVGSDCGGSACDYQTLDNALTAIEQSQTDAYYNIFVTDVEHHIKSHVLPYFVYIELDSSESDQLVIYGDQSVITTSKEFSFSAPKIEVKDLNIVYNGDVYPEDVTPPQGVDIVYEAFGLYGDKSITCSNVKVTTKVNFNFENRLFAAPLGLIAMAEKIQFKNVVIDGFDLGCSLEVDDFTLENSSLQNNYLSIALHEYSWPSPESISAKIINSQLTRVVYVGDPAITVQTEGGNLLPIKYLDETTGNYYCNDPATCNMRESFSDKAFYLRKNTDIVKEITNTKTITVNFNNQKTVDDVVALFRMNTLLDDEEFVVTSSDSSIATVDGRKVKFLKTGDVTITAVSESTHETYTAQFKVAIPSENPNTGRHILYMILGCLLLVSVSVVSYKKRSKNND